MEGGKRKQENRKFKKDKRRWIVMEGERSEIGGERRGGKKNEMEEGRKGRKLERGQ